MSSSHHWCAIKRMGFLTTLNSLSHIPPKQQCFVVDKSAQDLSFVLRSSLDSIFKREHHRFGGQSLVSLSSFIPTSCSGRRTAATNSLSSASRTVIRFAGSTSQKTRFAHWKPTSLSATPEPIVQHEETSPRSPLEACNQGTTSTIIHLPISHSHPSMVLHPTA